MSQPSSPGTSTGPGTPTRPDPKGLRSSYADVRDLTEDAVTLARRWAEETEHGQTDQERATAGQLASLVRDPAGLELAVAFVDKVARPEDLGVAARELSRISTASAASFLKGTDLALLTAGTLVARLAPSVVVPLARQRLRQLVGHLVVDSHDPALANHLAKARAEGYRLNINLLGEAVLGESEAASRTERVEKLLARPDVDYVSIKVSSLVSQISPWDTEGTVRRCLDRLRPLYRAAAATNPPGFVNLDMEEYRDLDLTIDLFTRLLDEEEFRSLEAGIVLQAYLPDALPAMQRLVEWATARRASGGAGIKIRLVKGANLAMEHVEAVLHGWPQAPYPDKPQVDANYLNCVEFGLRPEHADAVRIGVASHNLFDVALAHLLAQKRGVDAALDVEMLQGMAPAQARAVKAAVGSVLLYTPVVAPEDFDVAVAYLIRRLEENASPQNFLAALFSKPDDAEAALDEQERRFRESVTLAESNEVGARRRNVRPEIGEVFANTPDTDHAVPSARAWAAAALAATPTPATSRVLDSPDAVDDVVRRAVAAAPLWAARPAAERAALLRQAARELEARRADLLTVMAAEGGKTVAEADPELSEAIDFARYYADRAVELADGSGSDQLDGARFEPARVTLVTPPWNFPVAIPIGGVLAALAAGSAVIIKPAGPTPACVEVACDALHAAGIGEEVLQVVRTDEGETGQALVSHPDVDLVILTGASETAELFATWRAGHRRAPGVLGETSGKNSLIITPAADLDLAVADLVKSAFGHAGQKCSAASLAILVGSVATSEKFRRQLVDAVSSLRVGWPSDLGAAMGPVIGKPEGKLLRALTTLEPGESWLVQPRMLDGTGRLWSPGLKEGVSPGSFFHLTEVFGPVLGLMTAETLDEAIALQNATAYGLTGGLHSLDEKEIATWLNRVEVGNAYVNRHITGAIVQRQPFGGWKASNVGPGAKAGGPNYVAQLGTWHSTALPSRLGDPSRQVREELAVLLPLVAERSDRTWLRAAIGSDAHAWETLGVETDLSGLGVESNVLRYRPAPRVWVRSEPGARVVEIVRLLLAGTATGADVRVSLDLETSAYLRAMDGRDEPTGAALRRLARRVDRAEPQERFIARVRSGEVAGRIRVVGDDAGLQRELAGDLRVTVLGGVVLATGRRELLTMLREQAISATRHRFGHVSTR